MTPLPERLRDALGAVRCLFPGAPPAARAAFEAAGRALSAAMTDPELVEPARQALREAAIAAPWAGPTLLGALEHLRETPSNRPPPPFFQQ